MTKLKLTAETMLKLSSNLEDFQPTFQMVRIFSNFGSLCPEKSWMYTKGRTYKLTNEK